MAAKKKTEKPEQSEQQVVTPRMSAMGMLAAMGEPQAPETQNALGHAANAYATLALADAVEKAADRIVEQLVKTWGRS